MFKNHPQTPRRNTGKPPARKGPRGSFEHNQWLCDCDPRIPAEHFQVKKEGKNKGRWFYTCQKHENERCGFFLWQEDAEPRMQGAVLRNAHTEPLIKPARNSDNEDAKRSEPRKSRKRTLPWGESDSFEKQATERQDSNTADNTSFTLKEDEEIELASTVATLGRNHDVSPETPRKAQKTTQFETPSSKAMNATNVRHGLATPGITPRNANTGRAMKQQQHTDPETPTPTRSKDALASEESLSDKAFKLLGLFDVTLNNNVATALRELLDSEARKWHGVVKGRDAARAAVSARDARIAEILETASRVEGENEANKALISHLRGKSRR